jgi:hypothetical protein
MCVWIVMDNPEATWLCDIRLWTYDSHDETNREKTEANIETDHEPKENWSERNGHHGFRRQSRKDGC